MFKEFIGWGSGFKIEANRDYDKKGQPFYYHLSVWGMWFDDDVFSGYNLDSLMKKAIQEGKRNKKLYEKTKEKENSKRKAMGRSL